MTAVTKALMILGGGLIVRGIASRRREYHFRDRVVVITGGSRGLGLVLAREFVRLGARVVICARDAEELSRAREELKAQGGEVLAVQCDITKRTDINELIGRVRDEYGTIDVLVNNAGTIEVGPLEVMTLEDFEKAMNTHFWGPVNTTLAVLPEMQKRRQGRLVNICSIGGKISVPHLIPYCASKFALVGFSQGLHAELAKDNIAVTTVCPGLMRTGSARNANFKGKHRAEFALFSLSAALPITSMNAKRAARQIITACKRGEAEVILSFQAQLAAVFHGIFPGLTAELLGVVNQLLPNANGTGTRKVKGKDSSSFLSPSILTALNDQAAIRNNEMGS